MSFSGCKYGVILGVSDTHVRFWGGGFLSETSNTQRNMWSKNHEKHHVVTVYSIHLEVVHLSNPVVFSNFNDRSAYKSNHTSRHARVSWCMSNPSILLSWFSKAFRPQILKFQNARLVRKRLVLFFVSKKEVPLLLKDTDAKTLANNLVILDFDSFLILFVVAAVLLAVCLRFHHLMFHKNKLELKNVSWLFTLNPKPSHGLVFFHSFSFFSISASPLTVPGVRSKNHPMETGFQREKFLQEKFLISETVSVLSEIVSPKRKAPSRVRKKIHSQLEAKSA